MEEEGQHNYTSGKLPEHKFIGSSGSLQKVTQTGSESVNQPEVGKDGMGGGAWMEVTEKIQEHGN